MREWLMNILQPIDLRKYSWLIGAGEEYKLRDKDLIPLFPDDVRMLKGEDLHKIIDSKESQYIIFADLKTFPAGTDVIEIGKYEDFIASDCELILLLVDSSYTTIYQSYLTHDNERLDGEMNGFS